MISIFISIIGRNVRNLTITIKTIYYNNSIILIYIMKRILSITSP